MALVVLGLFVLVWIISAVVKASQDPGTRRSGPSSSGRPRSADATPQRTSNSDIDRFMAEIDRLRRRGEGAPTGRSAEPRSTPPIIERTPRPLSEPRPRSLERRERDRERERERERRPRPAARPAPTPSPPPLPRSEPVPILRPVAPERPAPPAAPPAAPPKPARPAKPAAAATSVAVAPPSPVLQTLQSVIKSKQGPAAALILAEIFGPPPGARVLRPRHPG